MRGKKKTLHFSGGLGVCYGCALLKGPERSVQTWWWLLGIRSWPGPFCFREPLKYHDMENSLALTEASRELRWVCCFRFLVCFLACVGGLILVVLSGSLGFAMFHGEHTRKEVSNNCNLRVS